MALDSDSVTSPSTRTGHARRERAAGEVGVVLLAPVERDDAHVEGDPLFAQGDEARQDVGAGPARVAVQQHARVPTSG